MVRRRVACVFLVIGGSMVAGSQTTVEDRIKNMFELLSEAGYDDAVEDIISSDVPAEAKLVVLEYYVDLAVNNPNKLKQINDSAAEEEAERRAFERQLFLDRLLDIPGSSPLGRPFSDSSGGPAEDLL